MSKSGTAAVRTNKMSRADFAKVMGVDRAQVTRWAERGMLTFPDGDVDPVICANWVRQNVDNHKLRGSLGARQMCDAEVGRWQQSLIATYSTAEECSANYVAELLLPLLPEAVCRAVVARFLAKMREGSIDCLNEELQPPRGCRSWADDPRFQGAQPTEYEWTELLERLAAGELEKVDG